MIEQFSTFFANLGVPPLVAGLLVGAVFGFLLRGILGSKSSETARSVTLPAASPPRATTMFTSAPSLDLGGLSISASAEADIRAALQRGSKIEAIKLLREATGLGLKESKDVIDRLDGMFDRQDQSRY